MSISSFDSFNHPLRRVPFGSFDPADKLNERKAHTMFVIAMIAHALSLGLFGPLLIAGAVILALCCVPDPI